MASLDEIRADEAEAELALIAELVGFDPEGQLDLLDAVELAIRPPGPGSLPGLESAAFTLQLLSETERLPQHERHWLDLARAIVWRVYNDKKTAHLGNDTAEGSADHG